METCIDCNSPRFHDSKYVKYCRSCYYKHEHLDQIKRYKIADYFLIMFACFCVSYYLYYFNIDIIVLYIISQIGFFFFIIFRYARPNDMLKGVD